MTMSHFAQLRSSEMHRNGLLTHTDMISDNRRRCQASTLAPHNQGQLTLTQVNQMHMKSQKTQTQTHTQAQMREAGNASLLVDKILAMKHAERTSYLYRSYIKSAPSATSLPQPKDFAHGNTHAQAQAHACAEEFSLWREKICHWTFSVIDHFDLSRRTVAISMNLFDRYLATLGNRCDGDRALFISLTTLYIAIKVHEKKKIKLCTLVELSRGRFQADEIEAMELKIVQSLSWLLHPPTPIDFISHVLRFLPPCVSMPIRHKVFELARYMTELAVCDPFFVDVHASTTAFAAILNVLRDDIGYGTVSKESRQKFFLCAYRDLNLHRSRPQVRAARDRLRAMIDLSNMDQGNPPTHAHNQMQTEGQRQRNTHSRSRSSYEYEYEYGYTSASSADHESISSNYSHSKSFKSAGGRSRCDSFDSVESINTLVSGRSFLSQWESLITPC